MSDPPITITAMARIWVEEWSPDYGASFELGGLAQTEEEVAPEIERPADKWEPITPPEVPMPKAAFLDGVSRVEARAFIERGGGFSPGICASVGVGVTYCNGRAWFGPSQVKRSALFGDGASGEMPPIDAALVFESRSVPGNRPEDLGDGLNAFRAEQEDALAQQIAREGWLVIADGPARVRDDLPVLGVIKSHQKAYLEPRYEAVVRELRAGQRTPVFQFGVVRPIRPRYSWYVRLAFAEDGHPWAGIIRCEVSTWVGQAKAIELADITARHLPRFASKAFWDPRAPQNLVPIASLERKLRHMLGDRDLVYRRIRSALHRASFQHREGSLDG